MTARRKTPVTAEMQALIDEQMKAFTATDIAPAVNVLRRIAHRPRISAVA